MKKKILDVCAGIAVGYGAVQISKKIFTAKKKTFSQKTWKKSHKDGSDVFLTEGIDAVIGSIASLMFIPRGKRIGFLVPILASSVAGYIDDHLEDKFDVQAKGLNGHISALKDGKISTGALKIFLIGAGSAFSSYMMVKDDEKNFFSWLVKTGIIAGSANLVNLFDLKPGRALKVCGIVSFEQILRGCNLAGNASVVGLCLSCLPDDVSGKTMLGDTGANTLGAMVGYHLADGYSRAHNMFVFSIITGLTLASERVSFSKVIERNPFLHFLDNLGVH
ncbi:MAG: hypothetical protein J6M18_00935 [Actinomycetaceae bacterium]|nr:hypothetical protein [Actinomycetaceae bacterium]